jgi:hypothetical protein
MADKALIAAAIQHVKDVGPNSYEEWVGLIIDFTCNASSSGPTRHPGERSPDTPALVPLSCVWPDEEAQP